MKDQLSVSDKTKLNIPIANFLVIVGFIISTVLGYTNLTNRITTLETQDQLMSSDLLKKAEQTPKNLEIYMLIEHNAGLIACLLYTSPSPRDGLLSRMPSSA